MAWNARPHVARCPHDSTPWEHEAPRPRRFQSTVHRLFFKEIPFRNVLERFVIYNGALFVSLVGHLILLLRLAYARASAGSTAKILERVQKSADVCFIVASFRSCFFHNSYQTGFLHIYGKFEAVKMYTIHVICKNT